MGVHSQSRGLTTCFGCGGVQAAASSKLERRWTLLPCAIAHEEMMAWQTQPDPDRPMLGSFWLPQERGPSSSSKTKCGPSSRQSSQEPEGHPVPQDSPMDHPKPSQAPGVWLLAPGSESSSTQDCRASCDLSACSHPSSYWQTWTPRLAQI
jgi:hypothetical protein